MRSLQGYYDPAIRGRMMVGDKPTATIQTEIRASLQAIFNCENPEVQSMLFQLTSPLPRSHHHRAFVPLSETQNSILNSRYQGQTLEEFCTELQANPPVAYIRSALQLQKSGLAKLQKMGLWFPKLRELQGDEFDFDKCFEYKKRDFSFMIQNLHEENLREMES